MINIKNAYKIYKMGNENVVALNCVNLKIQDSEFVAIVGPSGSGKSTLLHMIGGLDTLDKGEIIVNENNLKSLSDNDLAKYRNSLIGFIFQSFNLQAKLTALENVELPLVIRGINKKDRRVLALKSLEEVELEDRINHKPSELSGGQQQRVCIARALVNDPQIILADEPTGNLDSISGQNIIYLLKQLNKKIEATIIVVTHDDRIAKMADRIIRILDGKIIKDVRNGHHIIKKYTD
jgi:putative ABC transport system ATP-binding protein